MKSIERKRSWYYGGILTIEYTALAKTGIKKTSIATLGQNICSRWIKNERTAVINEEIALSLTWELLVLELKLPVWLGFGESGVKLKRVLLIIELQ